MRPNDIDTRNRHTRIDEMAAQAKLELELMIVTAAIRLGIPLRKINHNVPGMPSDAWLALNRG